MCVIGFFLKSVYTSSFMGGRGVFFDIHVHVYMCRNVWCTAV